MATWSEAREALNAVTVNSATPVVSSAIDLGAVYNVHAMQIAASSFSGSGSIAVDLFGSLDGNSWYQISDVPGSGVTGNGVQMQTTSNFSGTAPYAPARFLQVSAAQSSGSASAVVTVWVVGGTD